MKYQHLDQNGKPINLPVGKAVCVGRNYAAHAKELGNPIPERPILFIKPSTSLVLWDSTVGIPPKSHGECHHELELAILIDKPLKNASSDEVIDAIAGVTLSLDLTLRDLQTELKSQGHPWEIAKAFDGACPVGHWLRLPSESWLKNANLELKVNGEIRQRVSTEWMLWSVVELLTQISQYFTLEPGDIVLTGTPAGVGPLNVGDFLTAKLDNLMTIESEVNVFE